MSRKGNIYRLRRDYTERVMWNDPLLLAVSDDAQRERVLCSKFDFRQVDVDSLCIPQIVFDHLNAYWEAKKDPNPGNELGYYRPRVDAGTEIWRWTYRHERSRVDLLGFRAGALILDEKFNQPTSGWTDFHLNAYRFVPCFTSIKTMAPPDVSCFMKFQTRSAESDVEFAAWGQFLGPRKGGQAKLLHQCVDRFRLTREGLEIRRKDLDEMQDRFTEPFYEALDQAITKGAKYQPTEEELARGRDESEDLTDSGSQDSAGTDSTEGDSPNTGAPSEDQKKLEKIFETLCIAFVKLCVKACNRVLEWTVRGVRLNDDDDEERIMYKSDFDVNANAKAITWRKGGLVWNSRNDGSICVHRRPSDSTRSSYSTLAGFPVIPIEAKKGTDRVTSMIPQMAGELLARVVAGHNLHDKDVSTWEDADIRKETVYGIGCHGWHLFIVKADFSETYLKNFRDLQDLPAAEEADFVPLQISRLYNLNKADDRLVLFDAVCHIICYSLSPQGRDVMRVMRMFGPLPRASDSDPKHLDPPPPQPAPSKEVIQSEHAVHDMAPRSKSIAPTRAEKRRIRGQEPYEK